MKYIWITLDNLDNQKNQGTKIHHFLDWYGTIAMGETRKNCNIQVLKTIPRKIDKTINGIHCLLFNHTISGTVQKLKETSIFITSSKCHKLGKMQIMQ